MVPVVCIFSWARAVGCRCGVLSMSGPKRRKIGSVDEQWEGKDREGSGGLFRTCTAGRKRCIAWHLIIFTARDVFRLFAMNSLRFVGYV